MRENWVVAATDNEGLGILGAGRTTAIQRFIVAIVAGFTAAYPDADPARYSPTKAWRCLIPPTRAFARIDEAVKGVAPTALVRAEGPTKHSGSVLRSATIPAMSPRRHPC